MSIPGLGGVLPGSQVDPDGVLIWSRHGSGEYWVSSCGVIAELGSDTTKTWLWHFHYLEFYMIQRKYIYIKKKWFSVHARGKCH